MIKLLRKIVPKFCISLYHLSLVYLGAFIYQFPSKRMVVIGVIGTRGKTTTVNFIWSCLTAIGCKTGLISTANIKIGEKEFLNPYHMTMPGRFVLSALLSKMKREKCQYAIIETPSEGIEQWRHKSIEYDIAVFTSLYPEYLEAHNFNFERCKKMQTKIFASLNKQKRKKIGGKIIPKIIVVNQDSEYKNLFLEFPADKKITYGIYSQADIQAKNIIAGKEEVIFQVENLLFRMRMIGEFNVYNALAAIATMRGIGVEFDLIKKGIENLKSVPGRTEEIKRGQDFQVFIDYAHDNESLKAVLEAMKKIKKNHRSKIILLVGAEGGGRDKRKRPLMGELAAKEADFVVVSNVDPYDDDPEEIMEEIAKESEKTGKIRNQNLFLIEDRKEGILKTLSLAQKDDIVLITGKGAEQLMIIKGKKIPWDDRKITAELLDFLIKR